MGQARKRGSFEDRKAQAIADGRVKVKRSRSNDFDMIDMYGLMASIFMPRSARKRSLLLRK